MQIGHYNLPFFSLNKGRATHEITQIHSFIKLNTKSVQRTHITWITDKSSALLRRDMQFAVNTQMTSLVIFWGSEHLVKFG